MEEERFINISDLGEHLHINNKQLIPAEDVGLASVTSSQSLQDVLAVPGSSSPISTSHARTRDIDTDMEALRMSRQDNPFLQQVLASRQSLDDVLEESDDANLMSEDNYDNREPDPLSMPEVHQHMIRSPPPTSWPKSYNYKMFRYPSIDNQEDCQVISKKTSTVACRQDKSTIEFLHEYGPRGSSSCNVSPRISLNLGPQQRLISGENKDRCLPLQMPAPIRLSSLTDVRRLHTQSSDETQLLVTDKNIKS